MRSLAFGLWFLVLFNGISLIFNKDACKISV